MSQQALTLRSIDDETTVLGCFWLLLADAAVAPAARV